MGYRQMGGAVAASLFTISAVVAPAFQQGTFVEAAAKAKLNKTELTLVVGEASKVKLKNAKAVKYESTNTKIATVNKSGKVKGKKAGTATIYVYDENGNVYKCKVTVNKKNQASAKDYGDVDLGGMEIIIRDWWHPGLDSDYVQEPENEYDVAREKYLQDMMDKYNFKIVEAGLDDWGGASSNFKDYVNNGGDDKNYIFTLHDDEVLKESISSGLMYDVSTLDCLDFSSEKFSGNKIHEKYSLGSNIYGFFGGYSEPRTGVYFNKQVLRSAGIDPDSLYDAQKNGTWTWDMFDKLMDKCQRDIDGDGDLDIFGLTLNKTIMLDMAVMSNGGAYVGKDKKGKFTYELESEATLEALQWCVDIFAKYNDHVPVDAQWDYYMQEWKDGKAAFMVDQEYMNSDVGQFEYTDFDTGFVMFPKGPREKDYATLFANNVYTIPACYDAERAWKIAFAWNIYTDPVPGYEDYNGYIETAKQGNFDRRTLEETLPMMFESKRGRVLYNEVIPGIAVGSDLTWNISADTDLAVLIDGCRDNWKKAIKNVNK